MPIPKMKEHKARLCMALKPVSTRDCGKGLEIMDEATASLDVENETLVQQAISNLVKNKTVLIIAHRMRTVAGADRIVVLKDGYVAEQGTPEELLEKKGIYHHMAELQGKSLNWSL